MKNVMIVSFLVTFLVVCGVDGTGDSQGSGSPHTVTYTFDWSSEDAQIEDGSITLQNDLGYEVVMTTGYSIAYTVSLIECPDEEEPADVPGMGRWLLDALAPRTAWAGHSYGNGNAIALATPHTQNFFEQEPVELGQVTADPNGYCQFFYLVGRADSTTVDLPEDLDMSGMSIYVAGTYQAPGGDVKDFVLHTTRAYSFLSDLFAPGDFDQHEKAFEVDTGAEGATVTLTRNLDRLFDGVDFEMMNTDDAASQVLKQLVDHAQASVVVTP